MWCWCTLLLWLPFASQTPERLSAPALYDLARNSVVRIEVADARGQTSSASGVLISPDGLIATNYHVIEDGVSARVKLADGRTFEDVAVGAADEPRDLAILKVDARNLPWLGFSNAKRLQVGSTVYALGAPKGLEGSLSQGLISGLRDGAEVGPEFEDMRVIQFTAPISPGSSGGPLLNETGYVIGLVCGYKRGGQNLNLAIPGEYVSAMARGWRGNTRTLGRMPGSERTAATHSIVEILTKAQTLCITVQTGSAALRAEIMRRFLAWGRLRLVSIPEDADLVLQVTQTSGLRSLESNQAAAWLKDPDSGTEIWAETKGGRLRLTGWSQSRVARSIADDVIRFYERNVRN